MMPVAKPKSNLGFRPTAEQSLLIAGPCSAESEEQVLQTALALKLCGVHVFRAGIWKPRTRPGGFEGVGRIGLPWLKKVREMVGLPVAVEAGLPSHIEACLENDIDIIWIGARTTCNTFAVEELAQSLKGVDITVMVKNPIHPELLAWVGALERMSTEGISNLIAVHRGFCVYKKTDYRNPPLWEIPIGLKRIFPEIPLICDPSHISGRQELISKVAKKSIDLLFDGLMVEVHPKPAGSLTDSQQQLTPEQFASMIKKLQSYEDQTENYQNFHRPTMPLTLMNRSCLV